MCGIIGPSFLQLGLGLAYGASIMGTVSFCCKKPSSNNKLHLELLKYFILIVLSAEIILSINYNLGRINSPYSSYSSPIISLLILFFIFHYKSKTSTKLKATILSILCIPLSILLAMISLFLTQHQLVNIGEFLLGSKNTSIIVFLVPALLANLFIIYSLHLIKETRNQVANYTDQLSQKGLMAVVILTTSILGWLIIESHETWFQSCYSSI